MKRNSILILTVLSVTSVVFFVFVPSGSKDGAVRTGEPKSSIDVESDAREWQANADLFSKEFVSILSAPQMQSQVTERVDELCENLDIRFLEQLMSLAATDPSEEVSDSHWLLGFNQLMEYAVSEIGYEAVEPIYRLATNEDAAPVMRDYASQHYMLGQAAKVEQLLAEGESQKVRIQLESVLANVEELVTSPSEDFDTLAGTTLLGLAALSSRFETKDEEMNLIRNSIRPLIKPIFESPDNYGLPTKVSAIQVAGRMGMEEFGPFIAQIASDERASTRHRLSAIATLRYYPDYVNTDKIGEIAGENKRLSYAANSLLKALNLD